MLKIKARFDSLPSSVQEQLLMDRDSHGNLQVSKIDTQQLLIDAVSQKLSEINLDDFASKAGLTQEQLEILRHIPLMHSLIFLDMKVVVARQPYLMLVIHLI